MPYADKGKQKEKAKEIGAKWYLVNKSKKDAQNTAWRKANQERFTRLQVEWQRKRLQQISEIKLERGCAQCGYRGHPAALHFDHLPEYEKSFTISQRTHRKWSTIVAEMEKCQVLCANCHAIQTAARHQEKQGRKRKEKREQQMSLRLA
jgi:hypothetical protein